MPWRDLTLGAGAMALAFASLVGLLTPSARAGVEEEIVQLLPRDAIPAIDHPQFVGVREAEAWMDPDEHVVGLAIGGDRRAYPIRMLSVHEIVNDVVGGRKVAITW